MPRQAGTYKKINTINKIVRRPEARPSSYARGYDNAWRSARKHYLSMHPLCLDCKKNDIYTAATEIHHTLKASEHPTLFYDDSLWMPLCKSCHSTRTANGE